MWNIGSFSFEWAREAVHKETKPYCKSNLIRATSARTCLKKNKLYCNSALPPRRSFIAKNQFSISKNAKNKC